MKKNDDSPLHILCIDDDPEFCQAIDREARKLGIKMTLANSVEEAKEKMGDEVPSMHLCNPLLLTQNDLNANVQTAFVCKELPKIDNLQEIKKNQQIHYVAGKPVSPDEAHYLLAKMCRMANRLEPDCDWVEEIPETLMNDYLHSTYEKLSLISDLIEMAKENPSEKTLDQLRTVVHKIAGSAGIYGRGMASVLCKDLEIRLKNKNVSEEDLDTFYRQLYLYMQ